MFIEMYRSICCKHKVDVICNNVQRKHAPKSFNNLFQEYITGYSNL